MKDFRYMITGVILAMVAVCMVTVLPARSEPVTDVSAYLKEEVVTFSLSNGISCLLLKRELAPTLSLITSFRVGSADESYDTMGAAHLLEHMLFKGTDKIGTKDYAKEKKILQKIEAVGETIDRLSLENPDNIMLPKLKEQLKELQKQHKKYIVHSPYDSIYTRAGGVGFNASTSRDKTAYYIELPSPELELWARLESERIRHPVLREFYLERNTVYEERLMRYESSPVARLFEDFTALSFLAHPYRHPTIGWKSNIPYLSIRKIRKFYYDNYTPENMNITIVGDMDVNETRKLLEKHFGSLPRGHSQQAIAIKEPRQNLERRFVLKDQASPYLVMGWHKPTAPSREDYVFDVVASLLSTGKSSRLYSSLVMDRQLASAVNAWNGYPGSRYDNLFVIAAAPVSSVEPRQLEKAIYDEIDRLLKECSDEDIQRVINSTESSIVFDMDTNMGIARTLNYYQTVFQDWRYFANYLEQVRSITCDDVRKVMKEYLVPGNRIVGILEKTE